ncbi:MAG TPA: heparan-alpha-glucosaminide N-acetyltransferase domain-containing protein [Syntrophales bacterium]|nr:heparan-alpha-glucosaminide N-acetyltransferase domain-containing protein [Syntrophales bacterium]
MKRVDSVDVLRGLALIAMVICHYPIFLSSGEGADAALHFLSNHLLGGDFGASWFVFLVGLSQVLSARKRTGQQGPDAGRVVTRGAAIFIIGLLFLLVVQGYEELWDWDILTFIGAATILLLPCRGTPSWKLILFCIAVLFVTPWLRSFVDLAPFYGGGFENAKWISDYIPNFVFDPIRDYESGSTVFHVVLGFFLIGQFPLLPWIVFPVAGFVIGRRLTENRLASDAPLIVIIGFMLISMGLFTAYAGSIRPGFSVPNDYLVPLSFYPSSFSMVIFILGVVLVLYTALWRIYDVNRDEMSAPGIFLKYCRQLSKYSLTIYVTHFAFFFIPLRIVRLFTGTYYLRDLMSTSVAFGLAVILLLAYYPVLKLWDRVDGKYSFEWLLARLLSSGKRKHAVIARPHAQGRSYPKYQEGLIKAAKERGIFQ